MPGGYDASGAFARNFDFSAEEADGSRPNINSADIDDELDTIAAALSSVLIKDGRAAMAGDLNMGSQKIIGLASGTDSTDGVNKGQMQTADAATLASAQSYADTAEADAKTYADSAIATAVAAHLPSITEDASGNIAVGAGITTSDSGYQMRVYGGSDGDSTNGLMADTRDSSSSVPLQARRHNSNGTIVELIKGFTTVGTISVSGTTTSYNTTSDARVKSDIRDCPCTIEKLKSAKVKNYVKDGREETGFLAQELYEAFPEAVTVPENPDALWMVDHSKLVPVLWRAVQSLAALVESKS